MDRPKRSSTLRRPVDRKSTLPRLLSSLRQVVGSPFTVWLVTAIVHPVMERVAEQRVVEVITPSDACILRQTA
jgi:hypothetical protein